MPESPAQHPRRNRDLIAMLQDSTREVSAADRIRAWRSVRRAARQLAQRSVDLLAAEADRDLDGAWTEADAARYIAVDAVAMIEALERRELIEAQGRTFPES